MIKVIRRFKPDIVHSHTPKAGLIAMMAAWICNVPIRMHTVAGLPLMETTGAKRKLLVMIERLTYSLATNVYVNSVGLKNYINEHIPTRRLLGMISNGSSNGINVDFYKRSPELEERAQSIRQEHGISHDAIVFSFVGRIVKDKGIAEAIAAFRKILRNHPNRKLYFLFVGAFEEDLDPLKQEDYDFLCQHDRVIVPGFQQDIRPWIMASDIFVFPSYREGFPNVVMQACCLQVSAIVSNINGCNEIISDGKTGIIVKPKDEESLFQAMNSLILDGSKMTTFAANAREWVIMNFDQKHIWEALKTEYEKLLNSN
jgi:glycosyltransferase involved in cell wall biosynthesis